MIEGGIGLLRGSVGGVATSESSREELEKKELERLALSSGETTIAPTVRKRGGKLKLHNLLEIPLAKDHKTLIVGEEAR